MNEEIKNHTENSNPNEKLNNKPATSYEKKHILIAFFTGILVAMSIIGTYLVASGKWEAVNGPKPKKLDDAAQVNEDIFKPEGKKQVSEDELANYKEPKDCSKLPDYYDLVLANTKERMKSIDLEAGELLAGDERSTFYIRWSFLPKVVDSDCKEIKITEIKTGDILNTYKKSYARRGQENDTMLIQKIN